MRTFTTYYDSPVGILKITGDDQSITGLHFVKRRAKSDHQLPSAIKECLKQLDEYFAGKRKEFSIPLETKGTAFQKKVWKKLQQIPYGKTWSYGDVARKIHKKNASRAVGMANHHNNIAIVIPCHRVIGSDGSLTGYATGVWRKKWLLDHENQYS